MASLPFAFASCRRAILIGVAMIWMGAGEQPSAQALYEDEHTPEGWAWARVRQGKEADFNLRCETPALDRRRDEIRWTDACRRISGAFLADLLTQASLRNVVPFSGIRIVNARIEGAINLQNVKFDRALIIQSSLIESDVNLTAARAESVVAFVDSSIEGSFSAWQLHCELSLDLSFSEFKQEVLLNDARVDGYVSTRGAMFEATLNAGSLQVGGNLFMGSASHGDGVILNSAKIAGNVYMDGSIFEGNINADSLTVGASLSMRSMPEHKATFKGLILSNAKVAGSIQMDGATFSEALIADALQVGVSLFMQSASEHQASFKAVSLKSARIAGNLDMDGAAFDGDLDADSLQVGGSLVMRLARHNAGVILIGAKIGNNIEMTDSRFQRLRMAGVSVTRNLIMEGATFSGDLEANALQVGASLFMGSTAKQKASFKKVDLRSAKISGNIDLDGAMFNGSVNANALQVGGSVLMRDVIATDWITINFAQISGNFDMRWSRLAELDLSGSMITGDFRLSGPRDPNTSTVWLTRENKPGRLSLRNTRVTNLMDTKDAWPIRGKLELEGFRFTHLGGFESGGESDIRSRGLDKSGTDSEMRGRGMEWWNNWVQRDLAYSPTPYEQLATALTAAGDREAADEIRYLGRVQQRRTENWPSWVFSFFLQYAAGFGIGDRTFRVLYWVIGISAAGALYLWKCVPTARKRGAMWCLGASVGRLLPVIELNKEFTDFFHDPRRRRLTNWQVFVFSAIGVVGWLLGAILVAAVSGLTQKP